jgi:hypothetical protein
MGIDVGGAAAMGLVGGVVPRFAPPDRVSDVAAARAALPALSALLDSHAAVDALPAAAGVEPARPA